MRRVYRVCRSLHAPLDGAGAMRVGGRWNSPGKRVVYMAESLSLAVLENLVHMNKVDFPVGYVSVSAIIPDHVRVLTRTRTARVFLSVIAKRLRRSLDRVPCDRGPGGPFRCGAAGMQLSAESRPP